MALIGEHQKLLHLASDHPRYLSMTSIGSVATVQGQQDVYGFEIFDREAVSLQDKMGLPVFALFAGFHGIEAIGVKILTAFIDHVVGQTAWNESLCALLSRVRLVGIPIVNPAGYLAGTRANGNGVDLMRNAPVESAVSLPFVGGHRLSPVLPYYRGEQGFEAENLMVLDFLEREVWPAPFAMSLDLHSGFGTEDYLWTPYAKQKGFPPLWESYAKVSSVLDRTLRNHVYRFEPQSRQYCTGGDVWDYAFDQARGRPGQGMFLPMTLEVGSWAWIRKSPTKAFSLRNFFNPAHSHRKRRVLRRHLPLLNLMVHVVADHRRVLGVEDLSKAA